MLQHLPAWLRNLFVDSYLRRYEQRIIQQQGVLYKYQDRNQLKAVVLRRKKRR